MCKLQSRCQSELQLIWNSAEFKSTFKLTWKVVMDLFHLAPKSSWNENLSEHLQHKTVRQRYKGLHPSRFVSEPRCCSGSATVRFLSLSDGAPSANLTSHDLHFTPDKFPSLDPAKSHDEDLLFGHGGSLALSPSFLPALITSSTFLNSDFLGFVVFFLPCSSPSVAGVVFHLREEPSDSASSPNDTL